MFSFDWLLDAEYCVKRIHCFIHTINAPTQKKTRVLWWRQFYPSTTQELCTIGVTGGQRARCTSTLSTILFLFHHIIIYLLRSFSLFSFFKFLEYFMHFAIKSVFMNSLKRVSSKFFDLFFENKRKMGKIF